VILVEVLDQLLKLKLVSKQLQEQPEEQHNKTRLRDSLFVLCMISCSNIIE